MIEGQRPSGIGERRESLNLLPEEARKIRDHAVTLATNFEIDGCVVVCDRNGLELCFDSVGSNLSQWYAHKARGKVITVRISHKSTTEVDEIYRKQNIDPSHLMDTKGNAIPGGMPIFDKEADGTFIGAAAFHCEDPDEDNDYFIGEAIKRAGFFFNTRKPI